MRDRNPPRRRMGKKPMKTSIAAALAGLAMASTPTLGADLFGTAPPPMTFPAPQQPLTEVGSNWYLRGDIGYSFENEPTIVPSAGLIPQIFQTSAGGVIVDYVNTPIGDASHKVSVTRGNNRNAQGLTADVGIGYRLNNYLRLEAGYIYWNGPGLSYSQATLCPEVTAAESNGTTPVGNLWAPANCNGYVHATQHNNTFLGSAYLDLGDYWGFTPYVGAGAGLNMNTISGTTSFYNTADGSPFIGNTTGGSPNVWVAFNGTDYEPLATQPQVDFGPQNWNRSFNSTRYSMAAALMAGFGFALSPSATLDVGYRYLNADLFGSNRNTAQQILIGIRYMAN